MLLTNNLRPIREGRGFTLEQVVVRLVRNKMSKQNLSHIEQSGRIKLDLANELAEIYCCKPSDLIMTGSDETCLTETKQNTA